MRGVNHRCWFQSRDPRPRSVMVWAWLGVPTGSLPKVKLVADKPKDHHSATLLIARRLIEQGFHDALAVGRDGRPTESALESWEWLTARTDWTRHNRAIPPPELRQQFYGSFEWCCR